MRARGCRKELCFKVPPIIVCVGSRFFAGKANSCTLQRIQGIMYHHSLSTGRDEEDMLTYKGWRIER